MTLKFIRKTEDFFCENCGKKTKGNGFTNHCLYCLWSKHVDVNPGDRNSSCGGLMKPVKIEKENEKYIITHRCIKCGYEKRNKASENDNFNEIIRITENSCPKKNNVYSKFQNPNVKFPIKFK